MEGEKKRKKQHKRSPVLSLHHVQGGFVLTSPLVPRASVVPAEGRGDRDRQWGTSWHLASQVEQVLGICAQYAKRFGAQTPLLVAGQGAVSCPASAAHVFWLGTPPRAPKQQLLGMGWLPTWSSFPLQCSLVIAFINFFRGLF